MVWYRLTPRSTHLGHFGDGGVTTAWARIIARVSTAQPQRECGGE